MPLPAVLLAVALCTAWLPAIRLGRRHMLAPWLPLALAAGVAGLVDGSIQPIAWIGAALLGLCAWRAMQEDAPRRQATVAGIAGVLLALLMALHRWPGFHNPLLLDGVRFSPDSVPFTLYANLDKGIAGLLLLVLCCRRVASWRELGTALRSSIGIVMAGIAVVMATAMMTGVVTPEVKWPAGTWLFLPANLLFTVVAEEAFFRGVIQEKLHRRFGEGTLASITAVALSALLFGLAHAGGGMRMMLPATLAGIVYAWAYQRSRNIEAAIAAHFLLNALHFLAFTYPART